MMPKVGLIPQHRSESFMAGFRMVFYRSKLILLGAQLFHLNIVRGRQVSRPTQTNSVAVRFS